MVQITLVAERNPVSPSSAMPSHEDVYRHEAPRKFRTDSRMSVEGEGMSEEEEMGSPRESSSDAKTPSVEASTHNRATDSASPKSTGFSSPMSVYGEDQSMRGRAVLDLSMPVSFSSRKHMDRDRHSVRSASFSHSLVPPYSPLSSSASMSSSSGSPSVSPEVKMDEISIHDIAKEVIDRRSQNASFQAAPLVLPPNCNEFDLPKNFYGYYVYQLELASRYSTNLRNNLNGLPGSPEMRKSPPLVGKVKPTLKSEPKDDEIVSYGSLLEQALRNGLKRSPSEVPVGVVEKKSKQSTPAPTPPPQQMPQTSSQNASSSQQQSHQNGRGASSAQISVEDVAKTSLRELLHSKQLQEAKTIAMNQQHASGSGGSHGNSRSSSPSVNLKTLLESQSREALKSQTGAHRPNSSDLASPTGFASTLAKHAMQQQQQQMHLQNGKHPGHAGQPLIYPHILTQSISPPPRSAPNDISSAFMAVHQPHLSIGHFKHKKLLEWTSSDVRDWVSTLTYCAEFAEIFLQQSVDGVALTLLNETHLMKNFGMKLGPAIKLRCAVWEILGLCQAASQLPQMQMPQYLNQKQIPVGHCIPQHHNGSLPKQ